MANPRFLTALDALPFGTHRAEFDNRIWMVTKSALAGGKAEKLLAYELGGPGKVSLNLYRLESGHLLKPCELSEAAAHSFVTGLKII
ncbi:MAG: hypothetical protein AAGF88_00410 [Pseudomonadota bacterium]